MRNERPDQTVRRDRRSDYVNRQCYDLRSPPRPDLRHHRRWVQRHLLPLHPSPFAALRDCKPCLGGRRSGRNRLVNHVVPRRAKCSFRAPPQGLASKKSAEAATRRI